MGDTKLYFVECSGEFEYDLANAGFRRIRAEYALNLVSHPHSQISSNGFHYCFDGVTEKCCMLIDNIDTYRKIIYKHSDWLNSKIGVKNLADETSIRTAGVGFYTICSESSYNELPKEIKLFISYLLRNIDKSFHGILEYGFDLLELPCLEIKFLEGEINEIFLEPLTFREKKYALVQGEWYIECFFSKGFSQMSINEIQSIKGDVIENAIDDYYFYVDGIEDYKHKSCYFLVNDILRFKNMEIYKFIDII